MRRMKTTRMNADAPTASKVAIPKKYRPAFGGTSRPVVALTKLAAISVIVTRKFYAA